MNTQSLLALALVPSLAFGGAPSHADTGSSTNQMLQRYKVIDVGSAQSLVGNAAWLSALKRMGDFGLKVFSNDSTHSPENQFAYLRTKGIIVKTRPTGGNFVGFTGIAADKSLFGQDGVRGAFILRNGKVSLIPELSAATGNNDKGDCVGPGKRKDGMEWWQVPSMIVHADGSATELPKDFTANAISNAGTVVGSSYITPGDWQGGSTPAIYRGGKLGFLSPHRKGKATGVNESGIVVGQLEGKNRATTAFLWSQSGAYDLNSVPSVRKKGLHLTEASAIDRAGRILVITGRGTSRHYYILAPGR